MLLLLVACLPTPEPLVAAPPSEPPPAPTPEATIDAWKLKLGLMARSDQDACDALREAWSLEERARKDPILREALVGTPGFRAVETKVHVDWVELSQAIGSGAAATSLVTIGGTAARLREPCLDATGFARWIGRSPDPGDTGPCTAEALRALLAAVATPALDRTCVCEAPGPEALPRLEKALEAHGMQTEPWRAWAAASWTPCEVEAEVPELPATEP